MRVQGEHDEGSRLCGGTAVESAVDWQSATGQGIYLDALHNN